MYIYAIFGVEDYFGIGRWHGSSNLFWLLINSCGNGNVLYEIWQPVFPNNFKFLGDKNQLRSNI
jgi:hypothetical protein